MHNQPEAQASESSHRHSLALHPHEARTATIGRDFGQGLKLSALLRELSCTHSLPISGKSERVENRQFRLRLACSENWSSQGHDQQINTTLLGRVALLPSKLSALLAELHQRFTRRNLFRTRGFYSTYGEDEKVSPLVRQLPWTHNLLILRRGLWGGQPGSPFHATDRNRLELAPLVREFARSHDLIVTSGCARGEERDDFLGFAPQQRWIFGNANEEPG